LIIRSAISLPQYKWSRFDEAYAAFYCEDTGAPGLPTRLMVGLQYLKYTFDLSDEELV